MVKLERVAQAYIAEQILGALSELVQERPHPLFQTGPIIGITMQMEDILFQPTPQFLNGVRPGSVGGEEQQSDGQVELLDVETGFGFPITRPMKAPRKSPRL